MESSEPVAWHTLTRSGNVTCPKDVIGKGRIVASRRDMLKS